MRRMDADPQIDDILTTGGEALGRGDLEAARAALKRAEEIDPIDRDVLLFRGALHMRTGELDVAETAVEAVVEHHGDDPIALYSADAGAEANKDIAAARGEVRELRDETARDIANAERTSQEVVKNAQAEADKTIGEAQASFDKLREDYRHRVATDRPAVGQGRYRLRPDQAHARRSPGHHPDATRGPRRRAEAPRHRLGQHVGRRQGPGGHQVDRAEDGARSSHLAHRPAPRAPRGRTGAGTVPRQFAPAPPAAASTGAALTTSSASRPVGAHSSSKCT